MSGRRGFTLLELMIVIAIMAIMATFAVPTYQEFQARSRLKGAANQLFTDFMNARMQAVSQNNKVIVSLTNNHQYAIIRDLNGNEVVDGGETGQVRDIHPDYFDVTFAAALSGFNPVFSSNGTGKNGTIVVTSSRLSATKCITISTAGRIKVGDCP